MSGAMKQECGKKLKEAGDALEKGKDKKAAKALIEAGLALLEE